MHNVWHPTCFVSLCRRNKSETKGGSKMKIQTRSEMGNKGAMMLLDQLNGFGGLGKLLGAMADAKQQPKVPTVDGKGASSSLDKLCATKKDGAAPKGTMREGDELKQQQAVEVAKLKGAHLAESKKLDGEKSAFEGSQKTELATFEKEHGKDKDVVSKRMKLIDKQAAEKGKFEKNFAAKKADLTKKYQEKYAHQNKWHSMQKKELEAKNAPVAKHDSVKVAKASYPIINGVVKNPAIHC